MIIERYGYKNTNSMAGKGLKHSIETAEISTIKTWTNYYGNPSYVFHMNNGDTYYLVDAYGAMNDINRISATYSKTKKGMFNRWCGC
jgi:hypothetical protein